MAGVALAVSLIDVSGSLAAFCVAGVPLSASQARCVCGRCGTCSIFIVSAEAKQRTGTDLTPRLFAWQAWHFQHLRLAFCGRRGAGLI